MIARQVLILAASVVAAPLQEAAAATAELYVSCASATKPDRTEVALFLGQGSFGVDEQREGLIRAAHRACRDGAGAVRFVHASIEDERAALHAHAGGVRAIALRETR